MEFRIHRNAEVWNKYDSMKDNLNGFTWKHIFAHTLAIAAISVAVICVISGDVCATASDYISGVGSAASVYAIAITL